MLPQQDTLWPPKPYDQAYQRYTVWDAWYRGDMGKLAELYAGQTRAAGRTRQGGILSSLVNFFVGRPVAPGEHRTRLHAPLAGNLARLSAELLLATPPSINLVDDNDGRAGKRLDEIVNQPQFRAALLDGAEIGAALGGTAFTIAWDRDIADTPWVQAAGADLVIPEHHAGRLAALTMWTEYPVDNSATVFRHLEQHVPGYILHGLYEGTATNLGRMVPLTVRPETEHLAALTEQEIGGQPAIPTGSRKLTAVYIPNASAKDWRRDGVLKDLGRSDFEGLDGMFDALDETWSSWMRDIRLAKARLMVPEGTLDRTGQFDPDREVYQTLNLPPNMIGDNAINAQQFLIRTQEHADTASAISAQIILAAGYSLSDLDQYASSAQTATEVTDRRSQSERTRDRKGLNWQAGLSALSQALMEVDAAVYPGKGGQSIAPPSVEFTAQATPDPTQVAQQISFLRSAEVLSRETAVRMANPDWTDEQVGAEMDRLAAEAPADPGTFGRYEPDENGAEDDTGNEVP
ncbi:phage portal protein [Pseudoclavibacter sp. CFCC 14310]|uniref:phage portal protein n=1 Tax=Pseudoclavibacter sp. CFCC 14310 TaxID=2615180 RepID=UPI0013018BC5|nr:phage portal protein [Pseudoclavibacter sp. CFCC 14310]KAB1647481.1 phage portal protein [Pseudoclavibacter sp. CFCC 14310]